MSAARLFTRVRFSSRWLRSIPQGFRWLAILAAVACLILSERLAAGAANDQGMPGAHGGTLTTVDAGSSDQDLWRTQNRCGVNALYVMLRLNHRLVSYDDLLRRVPVGASGTSMADLRTILAEHGLTCSVIRTSPQMLPTLRLPAIAYVWSSAGSHGHFVVLCHVTDDNVRLIDGTSGSLSVESMNEFLKRWDGYLVVRSGRDRMATYLWSGIVVLGLGLVGQSIRVRSRFARPRHSLPGEVCTTGDPG